MSDGYGSGNRLDSLRTDGGETDARSTDGIDQFEEIEFCPQVLLNDYFNVTGYIPIDSDWVGAGIWWHEAYYCASQSLAGQIFEVANAERVDPSSTEADRGDGPRADGGEDRFTDCEECGEPVDMLKAGVWKAPNDEQWWHEGCYDKVEKAEELAERIRNLMVPEGEFDGLSNDFHDQLDAAQAALETAVQRERLKRDQGIGLYGTDTDRSGGQP